MEGNDPIRLFVCGGQDIRNVNLLRRVLGAIRERSGLSAIVESGDRAGALAREWAHDRSISVLSIFGEEKDWLSCTLKIQRIVTEGRPDLAISFERSHRSELFLEKLAKAGVRTYVVPDEASRQLPILREA
jgi:hypothetical protein